MNYSVEYNTNDINILIRTFKGPGTMDDIISSWEYVINNGLITKNHKGVISDFRDTNTQIELADCEKLSNFFKENIDVFKDLKMAQIIDSPLIAFPILFEKYYPDFKSRPFSTMKAATNWIKY